MDPFEAGVELHRGTLQVQRTLKKERLAKTRTNNAAYLDNENAGKREAGEKTVDRFFRLGCCPFAVV